MIWPLLVLLLLSCATTQVVEMQPVGRDLNKLLADNRYLGFFDNDRLAKTFPVILDLVVRNGQDDNWQMQGVLQIFTEPHKNHSAFYRQVSLKGDKLTFLKSESSDIRVVAGTPWQEQSIDAFAVVYGFGQGRLLLQRQQLDNLQLATTTNYPLAVDNFTSTYHPFPNRVFVDQGAIDNPLNRSKRLLKQNLLANFNYENFARLGVYYGILHHEHHDAFQFVRLKFLADKISGKTTAVITLFFGEPRHKEFIVYQQSIVEERIIDGNGEMFMRVDSWDKARLSGVWYSKSYGRIGKVFFTREHFPRLPQKTQLVPAVAGRRDGKRYLVNLQVENRLSPKADLIFPAQITGTVTDKSDNRSYAISEAGYNFYRGIITISGEFGSLEYSTFKQGTTDNAVANSQPVN